MKTNTKTLSPWADIHRMVSQMSSLRVLVGDEEYAGEADIELDANTRRLTIAFKPHKPAFVDRTIAGEERLERARAAAKAKRK